MSIVRYIVILSLLLPSVAIAGLGEDVQTLEKHHELLSAHRTRLERQLREHGRRISRLKAQPRSVARDLQLKAALRSSQRLANKLTSLQERLNKQRDKLLSLYRRAIERAPDEATRRKWVKRRRQLARRRGSPGNLVARVKASPLDGAEDLEEKADLLKDSEEKLRRRIKTLGRRIARLERRAKLRRHRRAALDTPFVEQSTRRAGGQRRAAARSVPKDESKTPAPTGQSGDDAPSSDKDTLHTDGYAEPREGAVPDPSAVSPPPGGGGSTATPATPAAPASPTVTRGLDPATLQALSGKLRGTPAQKLAALKRAREKLARLAKNLSSQAKALEKKAKSMKRRGK